MFAHQKCVKLTNIPKISTKCADECILGCNIEFLMTTFIKKNNNKHPIECYLVLILKENSITFDAS